MMQHLSDPIWWMEVYIHFLAACSALAAVLTPFEQWAKENLSPEKSKKIHSFMDLISKYGALNNRPAPRQIWTEQERQQAGDK